MRVHRHHGIMANASMLCRRENGKGFSLTDSGFPIKPNAAYGKSNECPVQVIFDPPRLHEAHSAPVQLAGQADQGHKTAWNQQKCRPGCGWSPKTVPTAC